MKKYFVCVCRTKPENYHYRGGAGGGGGDADQFSNFWVGGNHLGDTPHC